MKLILIFMLVALSLTTAVKTARADLILRPLYTTCYDAGQFLVCDDGNVYY